MRVPFRLQAPTRNVWQGRCYQREEWDALAAIKAYAKTVPYTHEIPPRADIQILCLCGGNVQHAKMIKVEVQDSPIQDICSKKTNVASRIELHQPGSEPTRENQGCQMQSIQAPKQAVTM